MRCTVYPPDAQLAAARPCWRRFRFGFCRTRYSIVVNLLLIYLVYPRVVSSTYVLKIFTLNRYQVQYSYVRGLHDDDVLVIRHACMVCYCL